MEKIIQLKNGQAKIGKFGVEIECFLNEGQIQEFIRQLSRNDIRCERMYYNHDAINHWKIVPDGSVPGGIEIVSPVLEGEAGLSELRTLANLLESCGGKVTNKCGLHVHHQADGFNEENLSKVVRVYRRIEALIDQVMPPSRRGDNNNYCQSVIRDTDGNRIATRGTCRYFKVNLQSYFRQGTVEFRHHSGTVEADKMINWVLLTALIMEKARGKLKANTAQYTDWKSLQRYLNASTRAQEVADVFNFYNDRRKKLAA